MGLLIISEKEHAARRIANILSRGSSKRTTIDRVPVHRYTEDGGGDVAVVGLRGHVFNVDGEWIGSASADERLWWTPEPGVHQVVVLDAQGLSSRVEVEVSNGAIARAMR